MAKLAKSSAVRLTSSGFTGIDCTEGPASNLSVARYMRNFRITNDGRLKKRYGYKKIIGDIEADDYFCGRVGQEEFFIYKKETSLKAYGITSGAEAASYTCSSSARVGMFMFGGLLYILGDGLHLTFDGVEFSQVTPYIPTLAITAPNTGGGVIHESMNILSGLAKISYSPDGESNSFVLPSYAFAVVQAEYNGSNLTAGTDYCYDRQTHTLTTVQTLSGNIPDSFTVTFSLSADVILSMPSIGRNFCIYGGDFDSRVFAFGNGNTVYYSDVGDYGSEPTYFPVDNFITVGDGTYDVTAMVRHFDRLVVFTEGETWFVSPSSVDYNGYTEPSFPLYPLNSTVGCAGGGAAFADNSPITLSRDGMYRFASTSIRDERNAVCISRRIASYLTSDFLRGATVLDYEPERELWCAYGGIVYIYNYGLDMFYCFDNIDCEALFVISGQPAFFDGDALYVFDPSVYTDDGGGYSAVWESGFVFPDAYPKNRRVKRLMLSLVPEPSSGAVVTVTPNTGDSISVGCDGEFDGSALTFEAMDFSDFSFECEERPKTTEKRVFCGRFTAVKMCVSNAVCGGRCTVCSVSLLLL